MQKQYGQAFPIPFIRTHGFPIDTDDFFQKFSFISIQPFLPFSIKLLQNLRENHPHNTPKRIMGKEIHFLTQYNFSGNPPQTMPFLPNHLHLQELQTTQLLKYPSKDTSLCVVHVCLQYIPSIVIIPAYTNAPFLLLKCKKGAFTIYLLMRLSCLKLFQCKIHTPQPLITRILL